MTAEAHNLLSAFDALDPTEQQLVAAEILRRSAAAGDLSEQAFDQLASEVFHAYDTEEAEGGGP